MTDTLANAQSIELWHACSEGSAEKVHALLTNPNPNNNNNGIIDVNKAYPVEGGATQTALDVACRKGHAAVVKLLLAVDGIDPHKGYFWKNGASQTPLYEAHPEAAELLLAVDGIDVHRGYTFDDGTTTRTPLARAWLSGDAAAVKTLLGFGGGIDVHKGLEREEATEAPLALAAFSGHADVVKLLLGVSGIDVHAGFTWGDTSRQTPLDAACKSGHAEVVKLLLAVDGIDFYDGFVSEDDETRTPLFTAAQNGRSEVVAALLGASNGGCAIATAASLTRTAAFRRLCMVPRRRATWPSLSCCCNSRMRRGVVAMSTTA